MIFNKKNRNESKEEPIIIGINEGSSDVKLIEKPRICLFDIDEGVTEQIRKKGFNVIPASLGSQIEVPNIEKYQVHRCLLNQSFPPNLHEYDIIIIDMENKGTTSYTEEANFRKKETERMSYYFLSEFPQTIFDPRPYSAYLLSENIRIHLKRKFLLVIFASAEVSFEYTMATLEKEGFHRQGSVFYSNYNFLHNIPKKVKRIGKELNVINHTSRIKNILEENLSKFHYEIVFEHPKEFNGREQIEIKSFLPLLKNNLDEIVSYVEKVDDAFIFVFPQLKEKEKILIPLLEDFFPDLLPGLFPFSTKFLWKNHEDYWLPNHKKWIDEKTELEKEFKKKIDEIEIKTNANLENYSFLHDLITGSGDKLVSAVKIYFDWLEFKNVKIMDDFNKGNKEEDLQIELENGLIVVEIKGIGGTSKDSDCSQISKIKYRRAEEYKRFDIFALYIVNHERFQSPKMRKNPPFSASQIKDAKNDKRGLLTTWELFKLYTLITEGIITKQEAREALLKPGLITFSPSELYFLGEVYETYEKGYIIILRLDNQKIKVDDRLIVLYDEMFTQAFIQSIQINDISVNEAEIGEIGIKTSIPIKKKSKIYLQKG